MAPDTTDDRLPFDGGNGLPDVATCSYREFTVGMGLAVRITLGAPRGHAARSFYTTDRAKFIYLPELAPGRDYINAPAEEFDRRYLAQLDQHAGKIESDLEDLYAAGHARVVLLCFENPVSGPKDCHRRLFAQWWRDRTGRDVPELGKVRA